MDKNQSTKAKVRNKRFDEPRKPRVGKIKLGYQIWNCKCGNKALMKAVLNCPKCGYKRDDKHYCFPSKTDYYVFYEDKGKGLAKFGEKPREIPFGFSLPATECVRMGWRCYQGKKMFCNNTFQVDHRTGKYNNLNIANRTGFDKPIPCDPETCVHSVGGNYQNKKIKPGQCGTFVTAFLWLPDIVGFDSYEHTSGSIQTANNFQSAVEILTALSLRSIDYKSLRLKLVLELVNTQYQKPDGTMQPTSFFCSRVEFPFAVEDLRKQIASGKLDQSSLYYALPGTFSQKQLPPHEYDELVDEPRTMIPDKSVGTRDHEIQDLQGGNEIAAESEDILSKEQLETVLDLFGRYVEPLNENERKKFKRHFKKTYNPPKKGNILDWEKLTSNKANQMIDGLNRLIENRDERIDRGEKLFDEMDFSHVKGDPKPD